MCAHCSVYIYVHMFVIFKLLINKVLLVTTNRYEEKILWATPAICK